jgi:hypothetical protein
MSFMSCSGLKYSHINRHKYIYKLQSGFLTGYSTSHQLVEIYHCMYDLFQSNIITDSRCVCGFTPNSKVLTFLRKLWWCRKFKRNVLCSIYKWQFKRKVGGVLSGKSTNTSWTPPTHFTLNTWYHCFLYHKCLYTYYPLCSLSDLCLHDTGVHFIYVVKLVFNPRILFLMHVGTAFDNKICWAWLFGESPNSKVLTFLRKLWWFWRIYRMDDM